MLLLPGGPQPATGVCKCNSVSVFLTLSLSLTKHGQLVSTISSIGIAIHISHSHWHSHWHTAASYFILHTKLNSGFGFEYSQPFSRFIRIFRNILYNVDGMLSTSIVAAASVELSSHQQLEAPFRSYLQRSSTQLDALTLLGEFELQQRQSNQYRTEPFNSSFSIWYHMIQFLINIHVITWLTGDKLTQFDTHRTRSATLPLWCKANSAQKHCWTRQRDASSIISGTGRLQLLRGPSSHRCRSTQSAITLDIIIKLTPSYTLVWSLVGLCIGATILSFVFDSKTGDLHRCYIDDSVSKFYKGAAVTAALISDRLLILGMENPSQTFVLFNPSRDKVRYSSVPGI